jgi:Pretoxin HINT domain
MYDPKTARFLQEDPLWFEAGDLNTFRYIWNDPVNWTDPMGLSANEDVASAGVAMGMRKGLYSTAANLGCVLNEVGSALGALNSAGIAGAVVSELIDIGCARVPATQLTKWKKFCKPYEKLMGALGGLVSFEAGTLVRTRDGLKAIELIQIGDEVAAWDEATNTIQYQKVTERYVRKATQALKITVQAKDGKTDTFTVTPEHPFLTPKSQWAAISGYSVGDEIATAIGEPVTITAIVTLEADREVFNLSVFEDHSYAVGELGVWSHNRRSSKTLRREWERDNPGQSWPKDGNGRNFDVSHIIALADGGCDTVNNIRPMRREDHIKMHQQNGDFARWGSRRGKKW